MPRYFARYEQFLRIFALLETLSTARAPLDDQALIDILKDRLGLRQLSVRTLHRDCDFLASCGYPVDHVPTPGVRRQGWLLDKEALAARKLPAEPLTMLELAAFTIGRDLLRPFEGTVLWTGIESLRQKLERSLPPALLERLERAENVFHVVGDQPARYASRPRLISALSKAITDGQEIDVTTKLERDRSGDHRLWPLRLVIEPPRIHLLALEPEPGDDPAVLIDLDRIDSVTPRDATFPPPAFDVADLITRATRWP